MVKEIVISKFLSLYGCQPELLVRAPGRVNLIGEHTDYNQGFVLPMAIDRAIWVALGSRSDRAIHVQSLDFPDPAEFNLDEITHGEGWSEYLRGMAWALADAGYKLNGWEGVLGSNIPIASGLSSSAAIELAVARAFWAVGNWEWDGLQAAKIAQKFENEWLDLKSGIMDQLVCAKGEAGNALLIDCRSLETQLVSLPADVTIVVMDTKVPRGLVDSVYNQRVEECRRAAAYFDVSSLRDVSYQDFLLGAERLEDVYRRRAKHIITENQRVLQAVEALQHGDNTLLGKLMYASHESLRDDYEVSCRELDIMVELAMAQEGCFGARMTGAGFGGCAIGLVKNVYVEKFLHTVADRYEQATGLEPDVYPVKPSDGVQSSRDFLKNN